MTNITHATEGVSGITSSTGLPSGVTASYSSDVLTISGTPTETGTFNYTIDLASCGTDATGTITVPAYPGGVTDHLRLWLKADGGTNTTTADADVTAWEDQSSNNYDADDVGSNPPSYKTNGINFNPALDFSGSEDPKRLLRRKLTVVQLAELHAINCFLIDYSTVRLYPFTSNVADVS